MDDMITWRVPYHRLRQREIDKARRRAERKLGLSENTDVLQIRNDYRALGSDTWIPPQNIMNDLIGYVHNMIDQITLFPPELIDNR